MHQGSMILIFIMAFALVATFVWSFFCHDQSKFIRVSFLFFSWIYFLLAAVKCYLGSAENTLVESFWDIEFRTYIHYGIPITFLCAILLILLLKVRWFSSKQIIDLFCSVMFLGLLLVFVINNKISNKVYLFVFIVSVCLTSGLKMLMKKDLVYYPIQEFGQAIREAIPYIGAWVTMHCIFLPNELYLANPGEFTGKYFPFLAITVIGALIIIVILVLGELFLLPQNVVQGINVCTMSITLMGYIQNVLLNGKLEILDGDVQRWPTIILIMNSLLWFIAVATVIILCYRKKIVIKVGKTICIYLVLIQTVTLGYLIISAERTGNNPSEALTIRNSLEVAKDQNVLVFILDRFDSSWMDTLYKEDMEFCSPLSDFTFYRNATSQFANTGPGIPYLLTATEWKEEYGTNYAPNAYRESTLLQEMKEQGFDLGIYTNSGYVSNQLYNKISNYDASVEKNYDIGATIMTMWKCAMYQTTPFVLKNKYLYYTDDIESIVKAPQVWNTENDYPFAENLLKNGLTVASDYTKAFRFYHLHGAHEPYTFSEDMKYDKTGRESGLFSQIRGSLKIVYAYIEQLKLLGKYEDAIIIITADHGQQTDFVEETGKPERVSSPVIMIKPPYRTQEHLQIKDTPVSHMEMMASIIQGMGLDSEKYGITLEQVASDSNKKRTFLKLYPEYVKYTIDGNVHDINSWSGEILQE